MAWHRFMARHLRSALRVATVPVLLAASLLISLGTFQAPAGATTTPLPSTPYTECPAVGYDAYCGLLIWIPSTGHAQVLSDTPTQPAYDNKDDTLIGVLNDSSSPIYKLSLSSTEDIFGFDGDGVCTTPNPEITIMAPYGNSLSAAAKALCHLNTRGVATTTTIIGAGKYGGTDAYFTTITGSKTHGTVKFIKPVSPHGGHVFFSLEEKLTAATVILPPSTTLTTSLSGGGQSGTNITVTTGTPVTDQGTLQGNNPEGTVTYDVFSTASCVISVSSGTPKSFSEGSVPASTPVDETMPGKYYWLASYSGNATNSPSTSGCGTEVETVVIPTKPTTLTTSLSATEYGHESGSPISVTVTPSTPAKDAATLSGANASSATGSVTYKVFSTSGCSGTPVQTVKQIIVTPGTLPTSGTVTLSTPGTYYWQASYSGNGTNTPSTSACGAEVETVVATACSTTMGTPPGLTLFTPAVTGLTVTANGVVVVPKGDLLTAIDWTWGDGSTMTGCAYFPQKHMYPKGGMYKITVTVTGTNGYSATKSETVTVTAPPTMLTTTLSGGGAKGTTIKVLPGTAVTDTATLSGKDVSHATGSVTYTLYSTSGCKTKVATSNVKPVSAGGTLASSTPETVYKGGTYYWTASYSGNTTNAPSASACGAEVETVSNPVLAFKVQPVTVQKTGTMENGTGKPLSVEVAILSKGGGSQLPVNSTVTITLKTKPTSAARFEVSGAKSTSLTVKAVTGLATFPAFGLTATGDGYTLLATSTGDTSATSSPFNSYETVVACQTGKSCTASATNTTTGTAATITSPSGGKTYFTVNFHTTKYPLLGCTGVGTQTIVNWTGSRTAVTLTYTQTHAYKTAKKTAFKFFTFCYGSSVPFLTGKLKQSTYNPKNMEYEGTLPLCLITLLKGPCILLEVKSGTSQIYYVESGPGDVPKGGGSG